MLKKIIGLTAMMAALTACGGSSSSSSSTGDVSDGAGDSSGSGDGTSSGSTTVLEGVWTKPCGIADKLDPDSHYDIVTATFSGNLYASNIENYIDPACSVPLSYAPNPTADGTFSVGNEITTSSGTAARELDAHVTRYNGAEFDIHDYTTFVITGNTLYFGDQSGVNDGTTQAQRSTTLDFERAFFKQ
ncbi:hypothetical protein [Oceanospirillum maris]|uniref:hypothetical protein n=1 Tax=Oceanospirillum maris TaxID=64977 RepID=UPI00040F84C2|nr:hypothetical protein [Oceanospirillum maris]